MVSYFNGPLSTMFPPSAAASHRHSPSSAQSAAAAAAAAAAQATSYLPSPYSTSYHQPFPGASQYSSDLNSNSMYTPAAFSPFDTAAATAASVPPGAGSPGASWHSHSPWSSAPSAFNSASARTPYGNPDPLANAWQQPLPQTSTPQHNEVQSSSVTEGVAAATSSSVAATSTGPEELSPGGQAQQQAPSSAAAGEVSASLNPPSTASPGLAADASGGVYPAPSSSPSPHTPTPSSSSQPGQQSSGPTYNPTGLPGSDIFAKAAYQIQTPVSPSGLTHAASSPVYGASSSSLAVGLNGSDGHALSPGSATPPPSVATTTSSSRPQPARSPFEWMKKPSYQSQPEKNGRTRTKDKYRVVYSDHQRLELEKEFHYSRYITIRRKAELANNVGLSERQVKIWFQNRRAKERRALKKQEDVTCKEKMDVAQSFVAANSVSAFQETLSHGIFPTPFPPHSMGAPQPHPFPPMKIE